MMQRYYFLLENMYRAMIIFWLTCLVGYPRTSAPEPKFAGGFGVVKLFKDAVLGLLLDTILGDWNDLKQGYNDGLKRK